MAQGGDAHSWAQSSRISWQTRFLPDQVAVSLVLLSWPPLSPKHQHEYTIDSGLETKHLALFMLYPVKQATISREPNSSQTSPQPYRGSTWHFVCLWGHQNLPLWDAKRPGSH